MTTLVDAGLQDVACIDMSEAEGQRDCDFLIAASGRSRQHALAGARNDTQHGLHCLSRDCDRARRASRRNRPATGVCRRAGNTVHGERGACACGA